MYRRTYNQRSTDLLHSSLNPVLYPGSPKMDTGQKSRPSKIKSQEIGSAEKATPISEAPKVPINPVETTNSAIADTSLSSADVSAKHKSKDLMISYSHTDNDTMLRVRDKLEQNGISVWVDVSGLSAGVDFLSKIGAAIIDAKLFLSLLSLNCVKSRYCQDEVALAYISDSAIFPVAIEDPDNFRNAMDTGMKLQLARYEWTLVNKDNFDEQFDKLIIKMKQELKRRSQTEDAAGKDNQNLETKQTEQKQAAGEVYVMPEMFWKDNFKTAESIEYQQFVEVFTNTFRKNIDEFFTVEEQPWLLGVLRREMDVNESDGKLYKHNFLSFCSIDGKPQSVWARVQDQARESYAMKEVFNMESSVRVEAIENLGKFRSADVISALRDLLVDQDANVRAVAAVSLARTETGDPVTLKTLTKTLDDKDRLVREAGCLALGHLHAKQAVPKLLHVWRNDVISHVREAAQVALQQIGGPDVEKAMHVTRVLAEEIRQLTKT